MGNSGGDINLSRATSPALRPPAFGSPAGTSTLTRDRGSSSCGQKGNPMT